MIFDRRCTLICSTALDIVYRPHSTHSANDKDTHWISGYGGLLRGYEMYKTGVLECLTLSTKAKRKRHHSFYFLLSIFRPSLLWKQKVGDQLFRCLRWQNEHCVRHFKSRLCSQMSVSRLSIYSACRKILRKWLPVTQNSSDWNSQGKLTS